MVGFNLKKLTTEQLKAFVRKFWDISGLAACFGDSKQFIRHNEITWKGVVRYRGKSEILIEQTTMSSAIIAYSYLVNLLSDKYDAVIKSYVLRPSKLWERSLGSATTAVFKSFNVQETIFLGLSDEQKEIRNRLFRTIYPELETKRDVENLCIDGTLIGDLVYDTYLRENHVPTIDIAAPAFKESLKKSLGIYVFWLEYFDTHDVKAVSVSHCVYNTAIILRIAVEREIPVYQITATHAYHLTKKNLWAYDDFFYFPDEFKAFSKQRQLAGLDKAADRLKKRFAGEVGVDMQYSKKSAYTLPENNEPVLKRSKAIKVLVATHCFFDSPHPYGISLFPDFYEWLTFLGGISERTDYEWYIKTHPDFLPGNIPILKSFVRKYPKFSLIPATTSHHQIISEGIDFALTVHGTIGFEYAALGIPVINASRCNPHVAYNFNIHPVSVAEYERILLDLPKQKLEIDINEVYEYYFMKFIHNNVQNWIFDDYTGFIDEIGGYAKQFGPVSYGKFLSDFNKEKHENNLSLLSNFVESKDYCMQQKHYSNIQELSK